MAYFEVNKKPSLSFPTLTGSIVTFNSQYALPLKSHTIALTATQSGSGTPSPDNVRTISGWSAINIGAVGKNFLETNRDLVKAANGGANTWTDNKKTISGIEVTLLDDGGINLNGTALSNTAIMLHTRFTVLDYPSTMKMYIGTQSAINGLSFRISSADLPGSQLICTNPSTPITIPDIKMNNADVFIFVNGTTQLTDVTVYPMILLSTETDTDYEPYNGTTTTIQIGSTVYGGEYDARTGVLTITHASVLFNGTEQGWTLNQVQSNNAVYITLSDKKAGWQTSICDKMQNVNGCWGNSTDNGLFCDHPSLKRLYFNRPDNSLSLFFTVEDWKTWLNNNNVRVCYELENPQTIQLPPCSIDTLEGVNNIWADTGDTTLQYPKFG